MTLDLLTRLLADSIREKTTTDDVRMFESVVRSRRYIGIVIGDDEYMVQIDKVQA